MPTNLNVNQDTKYQNTDLQGGHTISGTVTTVVDPHNLEVSFNDVNGSSQVADVAGIVDVNKQPIQSKSETAPKTYESFTNVLHWVVTLVKRMKLISIIIVIQEDYISSKDVWQT